MLSASAGPIGPLLRRPLGHLGWHICVAASAAWAAVLAGGPPARAEDPLLLQCLTWIHDGGYPSGVSQGKCEAHFDLPDPYTVTCTNRLRDGDWSEQTEREACHLQLLELIARTYSDFVDAQRLCLAKGADRCGS